MNLQNENIEPMDTPAAQMPEQILEKGICIGGQLHQFKRRELFDNKLSIVLPKNFTLMEESLAKIKYPMESRPQVIYMNVSGDVNFAFSHLDNQIEPEQVNDCCAHFRAVTAKVNPAYIFGESADETMDRVQLSWFEFVSFAIDMDIYNFMYIANVEGKILHGMFNCPAEAAEDWKIVIRQVVRTMKDLTIREQTVPKRSRR